MTCAVPAGSVPSSLLELAAWYEAGGAAGHAVSRLYGVRVLPCSELMLSETGWIETAPVLGASRQAVARQSVVAVADLVLHHDVIFNPIRARRFQPVAAAVGDPDPRDCRWCDPLRSFASPVLQEPFGVAAAPSRRSIAGPNHARMAPISGLVFGDGAMHDLLSLSIDDAVDLFAAAEAFIERASAHMPCPYWLVVQNGGARSASTVAHAHLQVLGRPDRNFGYAGAVAALAPADYWDRMVEAHLGLGLGVGLGDEGAAFANLAPVKERDMTVVTSGTLTDGARQAWRVVRSMIAGGTTSWSLGAIVNPRLVGFGRTVYRDWPDVVWRIVDRGPVTSASADIGSMELYGSVVVASDPFEVAGSVGAVVAQ